LQILVTGAAGFIGSHLSERLVADGHKVCGVDSLADYYTIKLKQLNAQQIENAGVRFVHLDLCTGDISPLLDDTEAIFHLAAQPGISSSTPFATYVRNNLTATHRLLEAATSSSTLRILVNISTSSVYGSDATGDERTVPRPTSYYGVTKLAAEQLVLAYQRDRGLPACSLRLFSVYGPRERPEKLYPRLIGCILEDRPFPLFEGSAEHLRSYTFVNDIVDGLASVLSKIDGCNGEIINVGSDVAITTARGIQIVEDILGQRARIQVKPKRAGDQLKTHAHIEKARRLLAYNPSTTAEEGLAKEVEWYKTHIQGKINLWA
jgi:nucleoside-diphosphate-sugar epimerase